MNADHVRGDYLQPQTRRDNVPKISRISIMSAIDTPETLRLVDHPSARNAAVATRKLAMGSVIMSEPVFTFVLFPDKTGRRCDYCHRSDETEPELSIRKCTGCGVQWYCGEQCT
jgi:hypothetical protein